MTLFFQLPSDLLRVFSIINRNFLECHGSLSSLSSPSTTHSPKPLTLTGIYNHLLLDTDAPAWQSCSVGPDHSPPV